MVKMAKLKPRKEGSGKAGTPGSAASENRLTTRPHTYDRALATLFETSVSNPTSTLDVSINDPLAGTHQARRQFTTSDDQSA